jgi:hypothetical protein
MANTIGNIFVWLIIAALFMGGVYTLLNSTAPMPLSRRPSNTGSRTVNGGEKM